MSLPPPRHKIKRTHLVPRIINFRWFICDNRSINFPSLVSLHLFNTIIFPNNFRSLWRQDALIPQMTQRKAANRHPNSFPGLTGSPINAALMLSIYSFVIKFNKTHQGFTDVL